MGKVKKNFLYSVAYQVLSIIMPLITAPYISRVLGADGVGEFSYTNSVVSYFVLAGTLGMTNLGNRSIAEVSANRKECSKRFCNLYMLQICSFTIALVMYILYLALFCRSYHVVATIQILYIIGGLLDISWLFFGLEKIKITVIRNTIIKFFTVICIFVYIRQADDVWKYALIMGMGTALSQVYLWISINKYIDYSRPEWQISKTYIKSLLVYFIPVVAYSVYKMMDKVMLGAISDIKEVGYYDNAMKIVNVPMGIINALGTVMLPRITCMISNGQNAKAREYTEISIKFVSFLSAGICFGLIAVSNSFAVLYYGDDFYKSGPLISMLSFTCLFVAWANVTRTQYLIPFKKDKIYISSTIFGAIVNIIINSLLIPRLAGVGAAYGTIAAEFAVMVYQVVAIRKEIKIYKYIIQSLCYIVNGTIMAIIIHYITIFIGNNWRALFIKIIIGAFYYVVTSLIISRITNDGIYKNSFGKLLSKINNR